jgi:hypothetical protein
VTGAADPSPEVRKLATTLLAVLAPLLEAATKFAPGPDAEASKCQQPWCPLCAAVAVTSGEAHPLTTMVAEHGAAMVAIMRQLAATGESDAQPRQPPRNRGRYEHIPVTIHEP